MSTPTALTSIRSSDSRLTFLALAVLIAVVMIQLGCQKSKNPEGEHQVNLQRNIDTSSGNSFAVKLRPAPPKPLDEMTKKEIEAYKDTLKKSGYYLCCTDPSCSMCLLNSEECYCGEAIKKGDPVCGECFRSWKKGKGSIQGVNPEEVRRR